MDSSKRAFHCISTELSAEGVVSTSCPPRPTPSPTSLDPCNISSYALTSKKGGGIGGSPVYLDVYSTTKFLKAPNIRVFRRESDILKEPGGLRSSAYYDKLQEHKDKISHDEAWLSVRSCMSAWIPHVCSKNGSHVVGKPSMCRERRFCYYDAVAYTLKKTNHAYDTLESFVKRLPFKSVAMIRQVYTLPPDLWKIENVDKLIQAVRKCVDVEENEERLKEKGLLKGLNGGVLALHLTHSSDPLRGIFPHVEVVFMNVATRQRVWKKSVELDRCTMRSAGRFEGSYFVRKNAFFDLERLKKKWAGILKEFFGYEIDWKKVDLYSEFVAFKKENEERIKKMLRYIFRQPVLDFWSVVWENVDDEEFDLFLQIVQYPKKRIRWFGYLADGVKSRYMRRVGVNYIGFSAWIEANQEKCPLCGGELYRMDWYTRRKYAHIWKILPPPLTCGDRVLMLLCDRDQVAIDENVEEKGK